MKIRFTFSIFLVLIIYISILGTDQTAISTSDNSFLVKVLLSEKKIYDPSYWFVESEGGFLVSDPKDNSKIFYCASKKLKIHFKNRYIYINDKKYLRRQVKISPKDGDLSFNGNFYQGDFILTMDKKNLFFINKVNLEDYIFAVLRSESWPGWPLEVNKVFAVATRSYVISKVVGAKKCKRLYHIKNDNSHQTYHGHKFMKRNDEILRKAVEQTRGMFLTFDGEPIDAMYDSCCGGIISADIENSVDFEKAPYLARDYPCKYCSNCSLYNWEITYSLAELEALLSAECSHIKNIRAIWVSKKDKAGLVKEVSIRGARRLWKILGEKLYSILKDVKSFCFSIKKRGDIVTLTGKGYGHHIGLCQWGVRQMVREFNDYKQILKFYYPGVDFMRLC